MNRIKHILISFVLLGAGSLFAQDDADLLRYSMLNPVGTARYNAMGGAFGALGANFTTLSTNPAGIGFYTRHEISLSLGTVTQGNFSDYYNQKNNFEKTRVNMPQGGGVFCIKNGNKDGGNLWSLHLGFGANRVKDFNNNVYVRGVNNQSSYMEYVAANSNENRYEFWPDGNDESVAHIGNLAYQTGLLDVDSLGSYFGFLGKGLQQKHILQEWGNITEMAFTFGGNWSDKVFFGITLGVPIVNYVQKNLIEEVNVEGAEVESFEELKYFNSYRAQTRMEVNGSGINLKLGLIVKPLHCFRIGLAFHTPTYFNLKENLGMDLITDMLYSYDGIDLPKAAHVGYKDYRYGLSTPMKGILSTAFLIKNFGAIAVEGEIIDYRHMRMAVDDDIDYNQYIQNIVLDNYRLSGVLRIGTEWKFSVVSWRVGYVWQSCPYKNEVLERNWSNHTITAGFGLNLGQWTVDFGVMGNMGKRLDNFYYLVSEDGAPLVQPARLKFSKTLCTLTVGCKF